MLTLPQVSIVALRNGEIRIVQSSMLGSILSNVLLVLGCCFVAGGIHNTRTGTVQGIEQRFNSTAASTMSSLLILASAALIIPATLFTVLSGSSTDTEKTMLMLSHGTAIILLILYVLYLVFQLRTHAGLFNAEHEAGTDTDEDHNPEEPQMGPFAATIVLIATTLLVAFCAEYLVDSIDALVEKVNISKTFIGLILLPIVGNAAEHVTAIVVALKDKMDLAMGVAVGSSMQIALLVTPFLVVLGWIMGQPMTLHFETFETVVFFLSVLVVSYVIADGKSNYLEGAMVSFCQFFLYSHSRVVAAMRQKFPLDVHFLTQLSYLASTSSSPSPSSSTQTMYRPFQKASSSLCAACSSGIKSPHPLSTFISRGT